MTVKRNPDIAWRMVEGQVILVHPSGGDVRVLNEIGSYIWEHLDEPAAETICGIVELYDVTEEQATADFEDFLRSLKQSGALVEIG